ncbi:MAG: hypothetical protein JSW58_10370 [Candidatus Latescibacterota bacterium]|nr:MAG: hypothetical protein JSW58_10370 [Candidatus Latescibacterota bacterium]
MKRALVRSSLVLLLFSTAFIPVCAIGQPSIALYFDQALTQQHADCPDAPPGTVLDTLYLAAFGFSTPIEGIEYKIQFPPEIMWIGFSSPERGLKIGDPINGLSMALFTPQDASSPVIIEELIILWLCEGCVTTNILIEFAAHPMTGSLRAVTSDLVFQDVIGYTSVVCGGCVGCAPEGITTASRATTAGYALEQCILDCPAGDGGVILPGELPGQHHTPDLDGDGFVSIVDFSLFAVEYLMSFDPDKDYYCSDNVDLIDFVLFTRHWLHSGSIPVEPSTWGSIKAWFLD